MLICVMIILPPSSHLKSNKDRDGDLSFFIKIHHLLWYIVGTYRKKSNQLLSKYYGGGANFQQVITKVGKFLYG